jgi:hypothetical protein
MFQRGQATEDRSQNLNKRVRFYRNRKLEERVKSRYQVARPHVALTQASQNRSRLSQCCPQQSRGLLLAANELLAW